MTLFILGTQFMFIPWATAMQKLKMFLEDLLFEDRKISEDALSLWYQQVSVYSSLQASRQSLLIIHASVRRPVRAMLVNSQVTEYSVQCSGGPGWKPEYVFGLRNTYHRWRLRFLFADLTALDWRLSLPFTLELSPVEHLGYFERS